MTNQIDAERVAVPLPLPVVEKTESDQSSENQWDFSSATKIQGATPGVVPLPLKASIVVTVADAP